MTALPCIHPTAIIEPGAYLATGVTIGPFCYVGSKVRLQENVRLLSHVSIYGDTEIGHDTTIYPFACLGCPPQTLRHQGEQVRLIIGHSNIIREHVTIHTGASFGGEQTVIGNNCFLLVASHIAHDCRLGDGITMVNNATLGGHVVVGDHAYIGGLAAIHPFVRIGAHAVIGGMSGVEHDVIPFGAVMGERAHLTGLNLVGLKRRGFPQNTIQGLRAAYQLLFEPDADQGPSLSERLGVVEDKFTDITEVQHLINFLRVGSRRNICIPKGE